MPESAKIDTILAKEWQKNKLQPNAPASDEVFLRRIYVDIAGRIPTSDEARAFLADQGKDKRAKLIDTLLASDTALGGLVEYALNPESGERPSGPFNKAVAEWEQLERFVESRLRRE